MNAIVDAISDAIDHLESAMELARLYGEDEPPEPYGLLSDSSVEFPPWPEYVSFLDRVESAR